jgi:predicted RNase H-like nuclease (RuvC/YqgF family)
MKKKECSVHHLTLEAKRLEYENEFLTEKLDKLRQEMNCDSYSKLQVEIMREEIKTLKLYHMQEI